MMDTILNLGLNDVAAEGLARAPATRASRYDSYRRLIQMFGEVVDGIDGHRFEQRSRSSARASQTPTHADDLRRSSGVQAIYARTGGDFPQDAREQLRARVRAVFDSWDTPRAQVYRRANDIPDDLGTAVNVVQMVFGNKGDAPARASASRATRRPASRALRRVPRERPGRGRRRRHPHAAADRGAARAMPDAYDQLLETMPRARAALPRHAGHRVHRRGRHSTCSRRAPRSAPRRPRSRRGRHGRRGLITHEEAVAADRPDPARPAPAPADRPGRGARGRREGPERLAGRGERRVVFDADTAEERGKGGEP